MKIWYAIWFLVSRFIAYKVLFGVFILGNLMLAAVREGNVVVGSIAWKTDQFLQRIGFFTGDVNYDVLILNGVIIFVVIVYTWKNVSIVVNGIKNLLKGS
jgi:hypothetical protein